MIQRPASSIDLGALSPLAPELAATVAAVASDIALVVDATGVIRNVALNGPNSLAGASEWIGRAWIDTVTGDSRSKLEQLFGEASEHGVSRRREVNHRDGSGGDVPVAYAAIRLGNDGPVLAVGRDLRAVAAIQQQFVRAQNELERDYWRRRQAEARYRRLFEVATDAVYIVDAQTLKIIDVNAATCKLLDLPSTMLIGSNATIGIDRTSRGAVDELLATVRATGKPMEITARLVGRRSTTRVSATPFRSDDAMLLLVRASALAAKDGADRDEALVSFVERAPYGIVVTDSGGRIRVANPAFAQLVGAANDAAVRGRPLGDWLGGDGGAAQTLLHDVQQHGIVNQVAATLRREDGAGTDVELAAVMLAEGDEQNIGFTLRVVATDAATPADGLGTLMQSLQHLIGLVGERPLPELERQGLALLERQILVRAFERAAGDIDAAAGLLSVPRAEMEGRMRRHGLLRGGAGGEFEAPSA